MKYFINQLKKEWGLLGRKNPRSMNLLQKDQLKYLIRWINEECVVAVYSLKTNPVFCIVFIFSLLLSLILSSNLSTYKFSDFLMAYVGILVTVISILFAAAIYVSSLYIQKTTNHKNQDDQLLEILYTNSDTIMKVYDTYGDSFSDEEKISLLFYSPCDAVLDQRTYQKYKQWHKKAIRKIKPESVDNDHKDILYSFDLSLKAIQSRTYYLIEGSEYCIALLNNKQIDDVALLEKLNILIRSAKIYNDGRIIINLNQNLPRLIFRLKRIIYYSGIFILLVLLFKVTDGYSYDFISQINFHVSYILLFSLYFLLFIVSYLLTRYMIRFIDYLIMISDNSISSITYADIYEYDANF